METTKLQQPNETKITSFKPYNPERKKRLTSYYSDSGVFHECPEGYMTGEEFVKQGIENINEFCKKHGLL
jgi:hypothetical protein